MFNSIYKTILNIIFPRKDLEQEISDLSPEDLSLKLRIQEHDGVISFFLYKDPVIRQMIWLLKYKRDMHVAKLFASALHDHLLEELSDEVMFSDGVKAILVPLPLSKKRERERGFNQMSLIAGELKALGGLTIDSDLLIKKKHTSPQTSLKKEERMKNIKDSFEVKNKTSLKNTHVILIDDVLTTGSTLKEAQRTLKKAGAGNVSCISLAH